MTVRSSSFCATLRGSVAPALSGLMRNDSLIALGRSANLEMNDETTYGGYLQSSFNQQGAAKVVQSPGRSSFFIGRQRQIAATLEHNVETIETILADKQRFPEHPANEEQATLATIKAQLVVVVHEQRAVINMLSGEAETDALNQLFNALPSTGSASLGGPSPLEAQEAAHDPVLQAQALRYPGYNTFGDSVYAKFARALGIGQRVIRASETAAATTIIENVPACVPKH